MRSLRYLIKKFKRLPVARILRKAGAICFINFHESMNIAGKRVTIPISGITGIQHVWTYDDTMVSLYKKILALAPGGMIDVGANIGQSLLIFKSLCPDRPYVGFEPNPVCVSYLDTLIAANGYTMCHVVPVALSDDSGVTRLFLKEDADSSATVIEDFRPSAAPFSMTRYISTFRLDDVARKIEFPPISVLKIDVEGFELDVLRGAERFIGSVRPFIVCEILPVYDLSTLSNRNRYERQQALLNFLHELNYSFARFDHRKRNLTPLNVIEIHSDLEMCDYLFLPNEKNFLNTSQNVGSSTNVSEDQSVR